LHLRDGRMKPVEFPFDEVEAIELRPLHAPVYERLREMIFRGKLLPGSKLEEDILSKAFRVSRTPLRQALQRLAHDGLVRSFPRRGTFVSDFTKSEIIDLLEVREALEGVAAALAARRIDTETLARLRKFMDPKRLGAYCETNPRRISEIDKTFH